MPPIISLPNAVPERDLPQKFIEVLCVCDNTDVTKTLAKRILGALSIREPMELLAIYNQWFMGATYTYRDEPQPANKVYNIALAALYTSLVAFEAADHDDMRHQLDSINVENLTRTDLIQNETQYVMKGCTEPFSTVETPELKPFSLSLDDWQAWKAATFNRLSAFGLRGALEDPVFATKHKSVDKAVSARLLEALASSDYRFKYFCGNPSEVTAIGIWKYLKEIFEAPRLTAEVKLLVKQFNDLSWTETQKGTGSMHEFFHRYMCIINHLSYLNKEIVKRDGIADSDASNVTNQAKKKFLDLCNKDSELVFAVRTCRENPDMDVTACFQKIVKHMADNELGEFRTDAEAKEMNYSDVQKWLNKNGYLTPKKRRPNEEFGNESKPPYKRGRKVCKKGG